MKYASSQKGHHRGHHRQPPVALAQYASHVLLARSDMVSFVDSLVGPLSIDRPHCHGGHQKKKDEVADTLRKIEGIWDEYSVYERWTRRAAEVLKTYDVLIVGGGPAGLMAAGTALGRGFPCACWTKTGSWGARCASPARAAAT